MHGLGGLGPGNPLAGLNLHVRPEEPRPRFRAPVACELFAKIFSPMIDEKFLNSAQPLASGPVGVGKDSDSENWRKKSCFIATGWRPSCCLRFFL